MKVALVHDDLVQWGGAERILTGISEIFPDAPIFTSLFDTNNPDLAKNFKGRKITTSFLQKIPGWRVLYKALLPFYPIAFEQFDFSDFDLVVSQSTRFAKSVITKPKTIHICYCHTPPRFLWDPDIKSCPLLKTYLSFLRHYDKVSISRADQFLAGSKNAKGRIKKIYGLDCPVVYPYIDIDRFKNLESFNGEYFLVIARLNEYKRVDLAIEACAKLNYPLKIIGVGPKLDSLKNLAEKLNARVDFLGGLSDDFVNEILRGAKALIICAKEDFGISSLEAQFLGKPVVAFRKGGVLETVIEGKTGFFFNSQDSESLISALECINFDKIDANACNLNAAAFSKQKFVMDFKKEINIFLN